MNSIDLQQPATSNKESQQESNNDKDKDNSDDDEFLVKKKQKIDNPEQQSQKESNNNSNSNIILTDVEVGELRQLEKLILSSKFIVVDGPLSSGKSEYIEYLRKLHNNQILTLFIDYTTDLKSLLGSYVCTEKIGQFEWKDGPLVKAMEEGKWLVFKNFQEANEEILSGLERIAQTNQYNLSSQGRVIQAHFRFKIIGIGCFGKDAEQKKLSLRNSTSFFDKIGINYSHLRKILKQKFPLIFKYDEKLVYDKIEHVLQFLQQKIHKQQNLKYLNVNKILALFQRINFHIEKIYGEEGIVNRILTESFRKILYMEVCDILVLYDRNALFNEYLHQKLLDIFQLSKEEYELCLTKYNPEIVLTTDKIQMGKLGTFSRNLYMNDNQIENGSVFQEGNTIVYTPYSSRLLEKIASCIYFSEPCLLVGDTGCGKTTMAQHCAEIFKKTLHIYNMSQGSDAIDLIGGFKPIDVRVLLKKLLVKYVKNFGKIVNMQNNKSYVENLKQLFQQKQFVLLMKCMLDSFQGIFKKVHQKYPKEDQQEQKLQLEQKFKKIQKKIENIYINRDKIESNLAFSFIEGNLIKAIKHGDWILIDEINLANNEVLQKLLPIIEGKSLVLYERGDLREIKRHKDFRILTCMNPGSDIGKKELPQNIKQKFTEIFVHDIEQQSDILNFVSNKMKGICDIQIAEKVVHLFQDIKKACKENLLEDGYNKRQHVSLRNLSRALNYVRQNIKIYGLERVLYDGLYLGFGTALSKQSQKYFENQLETIIGVSSQYYNNQLLKQKPKIPNDCVELYGFFLKQGLEYGKTQKEEFLVTDTFRKYIIDLLRAIAHTDLPVLLEGPTSSGKTSIVKYIASICGYKCVRVNNHQHTDIEEYIGTYLPDNKGRLVFQEGVLIEAMKKGHWLILDELNLARSEILESLNRLLDDNKEIFINETQQYIKPHKNFRLFATQNPTTYGGRKELSKAFKNRFIQLYFDEICDEDLKLILEKRCVIAPSYCKRLMNILKDLKVFRQRQNFFMGKEGVVTVRDLIKWGQRTVENLEQLGMEGYCLLAERLRSEEERAYIKKVIEKHLKVKLDIQSYYTQYTMTHLDPYLKDFPYYLQINHSFRRMACLALKSIQQNEPVLLIGETGCGKTTISQLIAHIKHTQLYSINCHQYTESSDFLGSLRPVRQKQNEKLETLISYIQKNNQELYKIMIDQTVQIDKRIEQLKESQVYSSLQYSQEQIKEIEELLVQSETMFEWQDGPLIQSMQEGAVFLIDEISLAEDSVLERLNSVLEPTRSILLPEKGTQDLEEVQAKDGFLIIGTMNPGGDFGKKELSPALRNRFTEIWVEPITAKAYLEIQTELQQNDVYNMINDYLTVKNVFNQEQIQPRNALAKCLFEFLRFFNLEFVVKFSLEKRVLTMRDILAIMEFIVKCRQQNNQMGIQSLYNNAIQLVVMESIGFLMISENEKQVIRKEINQFLQNQQEFLQNEDQLQIKDDNMEIEQQQDNQFELDSEIEYGIQDFRIKKGTYQKNQNNIDIKYSLAPQKVKDNLKKVMRGLQLDKSILLEGMPGVGKSSLIEYIAYKSHKKLVKISLSEQTDIVDLLGSDLPSTSSHKQNEDNNNNQEQNQQDQEQRMSFRWYDGVLLDALKTGKWLLLDELNLASQTILEGLNAILDHRGTVFIPEMNESFQKHPDFRIFACQNPMQIGGGRKGLPSSFLNRFTKIYFEEFDQQDLQQILRDLNQLQNEQQSSEEDRNILQSVIDFCLQERCGNLRDLLRFYEIYQNEKENLKMGLEIAFLEKEKQYFRKKQLQQLMKEKYFSFIYESLNDLQLHDQIPQNFNYSYTHKNDLKTSFILNSQQQIFKNTYSILDSQNAFMISGAKGTGKNSFVELLRSLKNLNNNQNVIKIEEISLNSQVDSTELIGAYDQVDLKRQFSLLAQQVEEYLQFILDNNNEQSLSFNIFELKGGLQKQMALIYNSEDVIENKSFIQERNLLNFVHKLLQKIKELLEKENNINQQQQHQIIIEKKEKDLENFLKELQKFLDFSQQDQFKGNFDWFFSNIIQAVKQGNWLVLDNVQNANQAVLARLNPLLEKPLFQQKAKLVITECHQPSNDSQEQQQIEEEIMEIEVHQDFKLFLLWDSSCNAAENISLQNKCVQINLDSYLESQRNLEVYKSDLSSQVEYKFGKLVNEQLKDILVSLDMRYRTLLPNYQSMNVEFRSFDKFLNQVKNSAFESESDYFSEQIKECFLKAYGANLKLYNISQEKIFQNILYKKQSNTILEQDQEQQDVAYENFKKNIDKILNLDKQSLQVLNYSNFSSDTTSFSLYKLQLLELLFSQNLKIQSILEEYEAEKSLNPDGQHLLLQVENQISQKLSLMHQIQKYLNQNLNNCNISLTDIQNYKYQCDILYQLLKEKLALKIQQIKVYQKQNEYKKAQKSLLEFLDSSIFSCEQPKQTYKFICQILIFLNNQIDNIVQYLYLIIPYIQEQLQISLELINTEISEKMKLKMQLWKACEYYKELPKNSQQDFIRKLVKFLLSEDISNEIIQLEKTLSLQQQQKFDMKQLIEIRSQFRNMYFVDEKTRLISMQLFSFMSQQSQKSLENNNQNNNQNIFDSLFSQFLQEMNRILDENELLKGQEELDKKYLIQIEDEFSGEILKSIPIYSDKLSIQHFTLKYTLPEQQQQFEHIIQKINVQKFEEFITFFTYANISILCLSSLQQNSLQNQYFVQCLEQLLQLLDKPDFHMIKMVEFLKKQTDQQQYNKIVEIYVLARIKNSQVSECELQDIAKNILSVNIKNIPFLNNQLQRVQKVTQLHLQMLQNIQQQQNTDIQLNNNYNFFDTEKIQLADSFLSQTLQKIYKLQDINEILEQQQQQQPQFLRDILENLQKNLNEKSIGKVGYYILKLFGFEELLEDNLSIILKEELQYSLKEVEQLQYKEKLQSEKYYHQQISNTNNDNNYEQENQQKRRQKKLEKLSVLLQQLKEKIVYRGSNKNIQELEYFFSQNQIFIQRIVECNLLQICSFQIEEFYQELALQKMSNMQFKEKMEEKQRELLQIVQHIDNFLQVSFSNFYLNFGDFLIFYYYGLLYVKDHILAQVRNIQQNLVKKSHRSMRYKLLNENYQEKMQNLDFYIKADLNNVDLVLDEIFDSQQFQNTYEYQHKYQQQIFKKIMDFCEENLLKKEDIDKLKEDDAKRFIVFQRKIQELIVDEYTKEAVEQQKEEELQEIQEQFNTYQNDFKSFLEDGGDMKERLERQKEDLDFQDKMENMDQRSSQRMKENIFNSVLKILKKDSKITKTIKQQNSYQNKKLEEFQGNYGKLGLQFVQNQVVNSDFQIHDLKALCEFVVSLKKYKNNHSFDNLQNNQSIQQQQQNQDQPQQQVEIVKYNVYRDAVQEETIKIYTPLNDLLLRIQDLLQKEEFYQNQLLQNLAILVDYLLDSNFKQLKLSKLITGLQFICEKCNEWDIAVPRMFSLKEQSDKLIELLLKWRSKEKQGWKVLLEDKEQEIQERDIIMFLKLRQLILQYIVENKDQKEFYSMCFEFISTSVVGTMQMRLYMLKYIAYYDLLDQPVYQKILISIFNYFSMFESELQQKIENEKKQFEKDIDEYRKLAGWDSKNYIVLKQTIEKFHRRIYKVCKRYKDFMQEPSRVHVFESYRKKILHDSFEGFYQLFLEKNFQRQDIYQDYYYQENYSLIYNQIAKQQNQEEQENDIVKRGAKILQASQLNYIHEQDKSYVKKSFENIYTSYNYMEDLIGEIFDRVSNLKDDEKSTKQMKQKAVQDLYKQLKFIGFSSFYKSSLYKNKTAIYEFENIDFNQIMDKFNKNNLLNSGNTIELQEQKQQREIIKNIETNYYSILDRVCVYKTNSEFMPDLSGEYIRRGGGYMIEFFYYLKQLYTNYDQYLQQYAQFAQILEQNCILFKKDQYINNLNLRQVLEQLQDIQFATNQIVIMFGLQTQFQEFLSQLQMVIDQLQTEKEKKIFSLEFIQQLLQNLQKSQLIVQQQILQQIKSQLDIEQYILIKDQIRNSILQRLEQQTSYIQECLQLNIQNIQSQQENSQMSDIQLLVQNIVKSVQSYKNTLKENIEKDMHTDNQQQQDQEQQKEQLQQQLNIKRNEDQLVKKLIKTLQTFNEKHQNIEQSLFEQDSVLLLQLVQQYLQQMDIYLLKSLQSFSKFGNILSGILMNLFYKGFCHPDKDQDENGNQEGGNQFSEGTGIGEGKGVQNVTDQMQFEEQMLGLKGEEEEQDGDIEEDMQEDQENNKENDFNMDEDFKGKNDQLDEEEKQKEQDKAEEQGKDEFDDVDDEQIDPKMWEGDDDQTDNEDNQEDDDKKNRKQEDLEFKSKDQQNQKEDENLQAKEKSKDKDKQRNIEDFEPEEKKEEEKEKQERDLNQEEINELNKEDEDYEDKDFDNMKEGEKLDQDKINEENVQDEDMEEDDGLENLQEFEQEFDQDQNEDEDQSGETFGDEQMGDPLDQLEKSFEQESQSQKDEEELEQYPDQVEGKQNEEEEQEQDDEQVNQQEGLDEEEEQDKKDLDDKKKMKDEQKKKKQDQRFGVQNNEKEANDDVMQEDQMEVENEDKKEVEQGQNSGQDQQEEQQDNQDNQQEKQGFSEDFLKEIQKTLETFSKDNFVRDLKIVEENEENQEKPQNNQQQQDENQEYEAIQFEDMEELDNVLATNQRKDMSNNQEEQAKRADIDNDQEKKQEQKEHMEDDQQQQENKEVTEEEQQEKIKKDKQQQLNNNKKEQQKEKEKEGDNDQMEVEEKKEQKYEFEAEVQDLLKDQQQQQQQQEFRIQPSEQYKETKDNQEDKIEEEEQQQEQIEEEKIDQNTMKQQQQELLKQYRECNEDQQRGMQLWQKMEQETRYYCMQLAEELKVILEPQQISNFKGDYKSGKRLNMKKIINYIASNFRKNKIWLRRSQPSKRTYQILLGIDDSLSMSEQSVGYLALQSLTTVCLAMSKMEVGDMGIAAIHRSFKLIHPLQQPLTPADVPFILSQFKFDYQDTHSSDLSLVNFMRGVIDMFGETKQRDSQQMCFIISDGRFNKKMVKPLISEGEENNILFVFIILDNSQDEKQSIMNIKSTQHSYVDGKLQIKMNHYLSDFPFKYYIVVQDVHELSKVLVDILRQYFDLERK